VWGGFSNKTFFRTGGVYDPSTDMWTPTSTTGAPLAKQYHTAVWTGTEMIVWGGRFQDTGGMYDPSTDTWTTVTTVGAPTGRNFHSAVWTGTEMIVWGGDTAPGSGGETDTGGRYDPSTDTWTPTNTTGAPSARDDHTTVWTGTEMIVWGGDIGSGVIDTGGRYDPSTDTWTPTNTTGVPSARDEHTATWTGTEMIVWGGDIGSGVIDTGARYDPSTDMWTPISTTGAPSAREDHTTGWAGSEMVIWGGFDSSGRTNTGGRYDPSTDSWVAIPLTNTPSARTSHTAVWTGSEMIVWGGFDSSDGTNTGGRYDPSTDPWVATPLTDAPSARTSHTSVWTGTEMIVWGGFSNKTFFRTGGVYDPSTDMWTPTSTTGAPVAKQYHTAVWTGAEMIVWGGRLQDTGGMYDPSIDTWTAVTTVGAPTGRNFHSTVWTGTEMIVWGGDTAPGSGGETDTGGRYDPSTDTWTPTNTTGAPSARQYHTATWTGTEMIVWGGDIGSGVIDTGGRYDPSTDTWTPITTTGAPSARKDHTAVWTGSKMIVWGGDIGSGVIDTGGRYDPSTDTWTPITATGAPSAREDHTTVWTGSKMVIWGGFDSSGRTNTGGRYDPSTDTWAATLVADAPVGRTIHTAVWTGSEMIVWGGLTTSTISTDTGGTLSNLPISTNNPPVTDAGIDQSVDELTMVSLNGTASTDADGDPLTYSWMQTAGTSVTLSDASSAEPTFTAPLVNSTEVLTFQLIINDGIEDSAVDTVDITVNDNNVPVADAGADQSVDELTMVSLNGTASTDADGDPLTYSWMQTTGPTVTLSDPTIAEPTFTVPDTSSSELLTFQLIVNDGTDDSTPSAVDVTVNDVTPPNNPPIADAGADQSISEGNPVTLDGIGSTDPDSNPITYSWSQTAGSPVTLSGATTSNPTFSAPLVSSTEVLTFQLIVNDGIDDSTPSTVDITVNDNNAPVADAGLDQTVIDNDANDFETVTLNGSGSDPDGIITAYEWREGTTILGTSAALTRSFSLGTHTLTLTVTDDGGATGTDSVTLIVNPKPTISEVVITVNDGYDEKNARTLEEDGKTVVLQSSDDVWLEIEYGYYTSFKFSDVSMPVGATITSVLVHVEHYEEEDFDDGKLEWNIGTGWPSSSTVWTSTNPTIHDEERNEAIDSWDVTSFVNTQDKVNSMELRVKNNDNNEEKKTKVDFIYVEVQWTTGPPLNQEPVANAGPDQTVDELTPVTLDGTGSTDADGHPLTYSWIQIGGTNVTLSNSTAAEPTFTAPLVSSTEVLTFQLIVNDDIEDGAADTVDVTVNDVPPPNNPPVADAGADQSVDELTMVSLNGTASTDADGDPLTYSWMQTAGTSVTLNDASSAEPTFTAPLVNSTEVLTFQLIINDGIEDSIPDIVDVTINSAVTQEPIFSPTSTIGAPSSREEQTSVWTGTEMIVWGGFGNTTFFKTGGRYDPATDTWNPTSTAGAPAARQFHTAVWTGIEMIVWGGRFLDTGSMYDPSTDSWTLTTTTGAPTGRNFHTAVWTGTEMIVWGGDTTPVIGGEENTGGRYNPSTDTWTPTSTTGAPSARLDHIAVWTGTEMIVWGGDTGSGETDTGGRYDPSTDTWTPITTTGAPSAVDEHTAIWTGTEMIVWGGFGSSGRTNTGAMYDPSTDIWTFTSITGAPSARDAHKAVWTGTEMIVWGGFAGTAKTDTGGKYNPSTDTWTPTPLTDAPTARTNHIVVWTGTEMIVWGGMDSTTVTNTGARLLDIQV